jgi:putative SOS response-associated peptidase YedK
MCYNVKASLEAQLKRAREEGDADLIAQITEQMSKYEVDNYYHTSGFEHKPFVIYELEEPVIANWGLIPHWTKSQADKEQIWNKTLNARGESIWEKPAFRDAAKSSRCLICIDGFYEYHHFKKKNYPFYISPKDGEGLILGGLSSKWIDQSTGELVHSFSIVTTKGNKLLSKLHNNPKLKEARMPLILDQKEQEIWLRDDEKAGNLIVPHEVDLSIHSVEKLSGKTYLGNVPNVVKEKIYPELEFEGVYDGPTDLTLFS